MNSLVFAVEVMWIDVKGHMDPWVPIVTVVATLIIGGILIYLDISRDDRKEGS